MSVVYKNANTNSFVKGSPDVLLDLCSQKKIGDEVSAFTREEKDAVKKIYDSMSEEALRVLAFAYRNLDGIDPGIYAEESEKALVWVGLMAMIDPPRQDVGKAIADCQNLGIKVIMITGDYEITARAIAKKVGLDSEEAAISGKELDTLSDKVLFDRIKKGACVFARVACAVWP